MIENSSRREILKLTGLGALFATRIQNIPLDNQPELYCSEFAQRVLRDYKEQRPNFEEHYFPGEGDFIARLEDKTAINYWASKKRFGGNWAKIGIVESGHLTYSDLNRDDKKSIWFFFNKDRELDTVREGVLSKLRMFKKEGLLYLNTCMTEICLGNINFSATYRGLGDLILQNTKELKLKPIILSCGAILERD